MGEYLSATQEARAHGLPDSEGWGIMAARSAGWGQWGGVRAKAARGGDIGMSNVALGGKINTTAGM